MRARPSIDIMRLIPAGCFVGTSLIISEGGRFLFGIRAPKRRQGEVVLEITGIGGGMESWDETVFDGVQREAREEIGTQVRLAPSDETLIVQSRRKHTWVRAVGEVKPAALVFRGYRTPPHRPWHAAAQGQAALIVFRASMLWPPAPIGELPALIWLSAGQILDTAVRDVPLETLRAGGARLSVRSGERIPLGAASRMTDSQEAIAIALGEETLAFYRQGPA